MTKGKKIVIISALVLVGIVVIWLILKSGGPITGSTAAKGIALDGQGNPKSIRFETLI